MRESYHTQNNRYRCVNPSLGQGVVIGGAIDASAKLAEKLSAPVCCNYQHNDAFPGSHPLSVGPLGYNGSKAAMELISKADVILALGTRLNPFSTLPGYGIDYWPNDAKLIQVDINADRIGLTKPVAVGIQGDAKKVAEQLLAQITSSPNKEREAEIHQTKSSWLQTLSSMDHEDDDPGTDWNERSRSREPEKMSPRMAWRAIQQALPKDAIISSDIIISRAILKSSYCRNRYLNNLSIGWISESNFLIHQFIDVIPVFFRKPHHYWIIIFTIFILTHFRTKNRSSKCIRNCIS